MKNELALKPTYWASVSGGKDSLYMLNLILHNLDKYPLTGVVHFELEIDYPFIKDVIDYMENECIKHGIKFIRIKPDKTWIELYNTVNTKSGNIYGFPTRRCRWCNSKYKLSCRKKFEQYMKSLGNRVIHYIGYCVDETKRYSHRKNTNERYPLVENGVEEVTILQWAKKQEIFNNYYLINKRCGCMYCPMASYLSLAYLYKYYPDNFDYMIIKMKETEKIREKELGRPYAIKSPNPKYNAYYVENIVKTKWLDKLNNMEQDILRENLTHERFN